MKIAISGKMCSGKTTATKHLQSLDESFVTMSFADPIYELAEIYFGMDRENKDRDLLIHIGESFRAKDPDVWVRHFMNLSNIAAGAGHNILSDDARLVNELEALKQHGWITIRLEVSRDEQLRRLKAKYPDTYADHVENLEHATETALDNEYDLFDVVMNADLPKPEFEAALSDIYNSYHNILE